MPMQMQLINGSGIGIFTGHWTGTIDTYIENSEMRVISGGERELQ